MKLEQNKCNMPLLLLDKESRNKFRMVSGTAKILEDIWSHNQKSLAPALSPWIFWLGTVILQSLSSPQSSAAIYWPFG